MNTVIHAIQHLSRTIKRLTRQLRRRHNTVDAKITLSLPPCLRSRSASRASRPKPPTTTAWINPGGPLSGPSASGEPGSPLAS